MRIAVTGASGNLGSALLRRLQAESGADGAHEVLGISRRRPASLDDGHPAPLANSWLPVDLSQDAQVPMLTHELTGYDALVHLAWKLQPGHDEPQLWRTNVGGTQNLLRAAVAAGVKHLVVITSVGAYTAADKRDVVDETYPATGIGSSQYSRHKAVVERLLDDLEAEHPEVVLSRIRPGLVFQAGAASEVARLFLGPLVPTRLIGRVPLPVLPLPRTMTFQAVHADDVAGAIWAVVSQTAPGAFNVAAEPVLTPRDLADAVKARWTVAIPAGALRALAGVTWRAHLQPTEPGWIDLATQCPIMSTHRIRDLGWSPSHTSLEALGELVASMRNGGGNDQFPPLIPRSERVAR